uniref:helix-hairpin-helix domain-containing protein n=1 Tax=Cellvibrio fontiphilus TaxID=1815559 RepID=UPI002B4BD794|nr:hypothetical protein [Cellvibrio fontiphilus]
MHALISRLRLTEQESNESSAKQIEQWRGHEKFTSLEDLSRRTALTANDLQILASADVLRPISGNRHESRWRAAAIQPYSALLDSNQQSAADDLFTAAPTQAKDVLDDYRTLGLTLRQHPMALLRSQLPPPINARLTRSSSHSFLFSQLYGG